MKHIGLLLLLLIGMISCSRGVHQPLAPDGSLDLGKHTFKVTTKSSEAQAAFNRGLTWAYAFGYAAAESEFERCTKIDPDCAMCWWGIAYVNGPHVNFPLVPKDNATKAWSAVIRAQSLKSGVTTLEKDLIDAQAARYAAVYSDDRRALDEAYAVAMKAVWGKHRSSADVAAMYAESEMDLRPWDYWQRDGKPQPGIENVIVAVDESLKLDRDNPLANHLSIHLWEASLNPERAVPSAEHLQSLAPGSGHLVHMPAHIFARVGRWEDAASSNINAISSDRIYRELHTNPGFYAMYMAHNQHFLAFVYMMEGRSADALRVGTELVRDVPDSFLRDYADIADGFMVFVHKVLMRFGRWEELLEQGPPRGGLPLSTALWRFTRATAFVALDRFEEAAWEQQAFESAKSRVPSTAFFGNNTAKDILQVATHVLAGELAARKKNYDVAVAELRKAVEVEDKMKYDEPPDWIQPVRHILGGVLLQAGRGAEAEAAYQEDLKRFPGNGWSLFGLSRAYALRGKSYESERAYAEFKRAWSEADIKIRSSCMCQPGIEDLIAPR